MRTTTKIKTITVAAVALIALAITSFSTLPGLQEAQPPPAASTPAAEPASPPTAVEVSASPYADTAALAAVLPLVVDESEIPAYVRASFGPAWADVDGNGCRQRDDVLARDLVDVEMASNRCTVLRGVLEVDPYTGKRITFQHDRVAEPGNPGSQGVQGEHIISLKAAHVGGAWSWSDEQRLKFANDLDNVIAVDGIANQSKQDSGPADWLPLTIYRCTYVTKYAQIAAEWGLAVSAADRDALVTTLNECAVSE
ncbi:HNH endonuclease family protein [Microbacterium sp. Be9]|uniref:HNH endonuclease family protein n=1 Tax=Microbacterium sp. Be9 TaxID=2720211 RepID=UPI0014207635|nr:HNH endonuclease family protein [Microbacterium sp. Be9]NIG66712.1 DUF1524 domain-containing protein [Microbacterium sp. Be9]